MMQVLPTRRAVGVLIAATALACAPADNSPAADTLGKAIDSAQMSAGVSTTPRTSGTPAATSALTPRSPSPSPAQRTGRGQRSTASSTPQRRAEKDSAFEPRFTIDEKGNVRPIKR